jgi:hypothetical protein
VKLKSSVTQPTRHVHKEFFSIVWFKFCLLVSIDGKVPAAFSLLIDYLYALNLAPKFYRNFTEDHDDKLKNWCPMSYCLWRKGVAYETD